MDKLPFKRRMHRWMLVKIAWCLRSQMETDSPGWYDVVLYKALDDWLAVQAEFSAGKIGLGPYPGYQQPKENQ